MQVVTVWSDVGCPWAHIAVSRLHRVRRAMGLDEQVRFDHHAFPLELFDDAPTPKHLFDAEVPVLAAIEPQACWQRWQAPEWHWPATTLPAMEAVQAAKEQSLEASEQLDRALRVACFGRSRCISLRSVLLDVARECPSVDVATLAQALDEGRARRAVMDDFEQAQDKGVAGSPHLFLPDGTGAHNPGIEVHWQGEPGAGGFPVVDADEPGAYEDLLRQAAG